MSVNIVATENPYRTPESKLAIDDEISPARFSCLAAGHRILSIAIVLYLLGTVVYFLDNRQIGILILLLAYVIGLAGFIKVIKGGRFETSSKVVYGISMFIPVLNVLVLAHLGELVIRELKAAGYKTGLFGVKADQAD